MSSETADSAPNRPAAEREVEEGTTDPVTVDEYTWKTFMREHGHANEIEDAYATVEANGGSGSLTSLGNGQSQRVPDADDWDRVDFDPEAYLGFPPHELEKRVERGTGVAKGLRNAFDRRLEGTLVVKDEYTWEHFKREYYYDEDGHPPRDETGEVESFEPEQYLGFDPEETESVLAAGASRAQELRSLEERRTVDVHPDLDEDEFFTTAEGHTTLVNRYDLEKAVPIEKKLHFREVERYWVNKPYAFVIIFHSHKENEKKYYVVSPYLNEIEADLVEFLSGKLRTTIKYSDDEAVIQETDEGRRTVLDRETKRLLDRYDLREPPSDEGLFERLKGLLDTDDEVDEGSEGGLDGIAARPEPAVLDDDLGWLTEYQVEKLLHLLKRNFIGYGPIDGIKHDINVEDISCDGYESPVFVYHTDYENLITNVTHREDRLDDFVVKLAQRSGKGISKRQPQVDASLPDGSRAQLTLGEEVSDHGTNYTIRQFKDVPFTPIDLINWHTFSLEEMAFLWLCIENHKSLIFAGGTASGKTTSLNAVSLFIPANTKIVSIEDTREVELPQRNWVASVTRPSFSQDNAGDIDEFDLLEAALRQRPDYIVMGEVRGEEGRTLFQVMSTGHTTYTTFHADTVDEVLKRFTTDPINVSKTLFTALDLVSVQTQTRVRGRKVRRNKAITEINDYDAENDEIRVQDVYQWQPESDEFLQQGTSKKLEEIAFDRGWSEERLQDELFERQVILAYLIEKDLNRYTEVAATIQAYINDPDTILTLIANEQLEEHLEDLQEMESVLMDVDPEKEAMVPRPEPGEELLEQIDDILEEADGRLFDEYRGRKPRSLIGALSDVSEAERAQAPTDGQGLPATIAENGDDRRLNGDGKSADERPDNERTNGSGESTDESALELPDEVAEEANGSTTNDAEDDN